MTSFKHILAIGFTTFASIFNYAQEFNPKYTESNKGKFYVYWGGNRGYYSNSDIHFYGPNYDFTVENATAHDKPVGLHIDYINPVNMTIPQTNFRLGYYFTDKYNISIGVDHMKYVMTQNQEATVNGYYPEQGSYNELMPNGKTKLTEEFLMFEHTDGLNYVNVELGRTDDFSKLLGIYDTDKVQFNFISGVGAGALVPKTNATVFGQNRFDDFRLAGYGLSAKAGLNLTFFKHFFINYEVKFGYIDIVKTPVSSNPGQFAEHDFTFFQRVIALGGIFRL